MDGINNSDIPRLVEHTYSVSCRMDQIKQLDESEVRTLVAKPKATAAASDALPSRFIKAHTGVTVSVITKIINLSLFQALFHMNGNVQ